MLHGQCLVSHHTPGTPLSNRSRHFPTRDVIRRGQPREAQASPYLDHQAVSPHALPRRAALLGAGALVLTLGAVPPQPAVAQEAAGAATTTKRTGLSGREVATIIAADFQERQYYLTGKLTPDIYEDDCIFIDPTTTVTGWKPYTAAVASLFDAAASHADIISLQVIDAHTIVLKWRLEGTLSVGGLKIKPYTGTTRYTLDSAGLVSRHEEEWDISSLDAFASVFLPTFGAPPAPPVAGPPRIDLGGL